MKCPTALIIYLSACATITSARLRFDEIDIATVEQQRELVDGIVDSMSITLSPTTTPPVTPAPVPTMTTEPSMSPVTVPPSPIMTDMPIDIMPPPVTLAPVSPPPVTAAPVSPVIPPSMAPTSVDCKMSEDLRTAGILARLDEVADPDLIRDISTPQGKATAWLLAESGEFRVCPQDSICELEQRWVLAVIYFSTGGPEWFQCSAEPDATDACGTEVPFVGDSRFLSDTSECNWAGINCVQGCVTEIEFEENNLVGTLATEIGLLQNLVIWGMERGGLRGTIPTEIGNLRNLTFLDLDFNFITGTLTSQLLSLNRLTTLDLNNNLMSGSIRGLGVFPDLSFLQIHANAFTGTVPSALGDSKNLSAFTLHETGIFGTMPNSICDLLESRGNGGKLTSLIADCSRPNPNIICNCCTDCRAA